VTHVQVARMEYKSQREEAEMDMKTIEEPPRDSVNQNQTMFIFQGFEKHAYFGWKIQNCFMAF
jgi:hypothetical protein